jgi:hypothetical protein
MLRHHMAVITADSRLKREVQRVTAATGSTADFAADAATLSNERAPDLAIFDARTRDPDPAIAAKLPGDASFIWILDEAKLLEKVDALADDRVVSLMCHDARFDDDEFIASATKALRGNVFGLPKYFPWGVTTYTMVIKNYEEKNRAIEIIMRYAQLAGVRGPVRDRIQVVIDELMMNGLYHAPTDAEGKERFRNQTVRELAQLPEVPPIEVQYGSSGRYFGVSVRDGGGSLTRKRVVEYLRRASAGTASIENKTTGAGLGLITVLKSVSKLVFNLDPGRSTEVIGLFDLELFAKGKMGARSVHVFQSREAPEPEETAAPESDRGDTEVEAEVPTLTPSRTGLWAAAAILLTIVAGLGGALVGRKMIGDARAASGGATVAVFAEPRNAAITIDEQPATSGTPVPVSSDRAVAVRVSADAYKAYEVRLEPERLHDNVEIHVQLRPESEKVQAKSAKQ